jgi:hypothetical protein
MKTFRRWLCDWLELPFMLISTYTTKQDVERRLRFLDDALATPARTSYSSIQDAYDHAFPSNRKNWFPYKAIRAATYDRLGWYNANHKPEMVHFFALCAPMWATLFASFHVPSVFPFFMWVSGFLFCWGLGLVIGVIDAQEKPE